MLRSGFLESSLSTFGYFSALVGNGRNGRNAPGGPNGPGEAQEGNRTDPGKSNGSYKGEGGSRYLLKPTLHVAPGWGVGRFSAWPVRCGGVLTNKPPEKRDPPTQRDRWV